MRDFIDIFRIHRDERRVALAVLLALIGLNAIVVCHYYYLFTPVGADYWKLFIGRFRLSGFDPITYAVVSDWAAKYNVYRHPLLAFFMYPPYLLNRALMALTGVNCAIFIVAAMLVAAAFYSFMFLVRIFRDVEGIPDPVPGTSKHRIEENAYEAALPGEEVPKIEAEEPEMPETPEAPSYRMEDVYPEKKEE